MKRYEIYVVIRPWDRYSERVGPDISYKTRVTANDEHNARRKTIDDTLKASCLVRCFQSIRELREV